MLSENCKYPVLARLDSPDVGEVYGRLTITGVVVLLYPFSGKKKCIVCLCSCGHTTYLDKAAVVSGKVVSCGCARNDANKTRRLRHGCSRKKEETGEYRTWLAMKQRCSNPNLPFFKYYGGRGISVCVEWEDSFEQFLADMGPRPGPRYSIDRIDNNKGYAPGNCRWATQREQLRNYSRSRIFEFNGKRQCLKDWAKDLGMDQASLRERLQNGWTVEEALSTPKRAKGDHRLRKLRAEKAE